MALSADHQCRRTLLFFVAFWVFTVLSPDVEAAAAISRTVDCALHPDSTGVYSTETICVGIREAYTPSPVMPSYDPDSEETAMPYYAGGWTWTYQFVEGLMEGAEVPWGADEYTVGEKVEVHLEDDKVTCKVTYGGAACQSCTSCGIGSWQNEDPYMQNAAFRADCSNLPNGRIITDCEDALPFYLPVELDSYAASGSVTRPPTPKRDPDAVVESSLLFHFTSGTSLATAPSKEEIDSLMEQINLFYGHIFMENYSDRFDKFEANNVSVSFDPSEEFFPFKIDFDADIFFSQTATPTPSKGEVTGVMKDSGAYTSFVEYVWSIGGGLFHNTESVSYSTRPVIDTAIMAPTATPAVRGGVDDTTTKSYNIKGKLDITFFPGKGREPVHTEIDALMLKTEEFFSEQLASATPNGDFDSLDATFTTLQYDASANKEMVEVNFDALIKLKKESNMTTKDVAAIMREANFKKYIEKYVRNSESWTSSVFDHTFKLVFTTIGTEE